MENVTKTPPIMTSPSYSVVYAFAIALVTIVNLNVVAWMGFVAFRRYWKGGFRQMVWSYANHVLLWDFIRCFTLGMLPAMWFITKATSRPSHLCNVIGPLTELSQRIPFAMGIAYILATLRNSSPRIPVLCCSVLSTRVLAIGILVLGWIISIVFSVLPFLNLKDYLFSTIGMCTYYSDQVMTYDENLPYLEFNKLRLRGDTLISGGPLILGYVILAITIATSLYFSKPESQAITAGISLLIGYTPSVVMVIVYITCYEKMISSAGTTYFKTILVIVMLIFPVAIPSARLILNSLVRMSREPFRRVVNHDDSEV